MNKSIAFVAALATLTDSAEAKWSWGSCPDVLNMPNFEPARYSGKWYEIVRDRQNAYTIGTDCVTREYAPFDDQSNSMDLNFRGYYMWRFGYMSGSGTMYKCGESTSTCEATMEATMQASMGESTKRSPFPIFYTDYENFDISYLCREYWGGMVRYEMFSLNTRTPEPSDDVMAQAKQIINSKIPQYNLDKSGGLYWTKQQGWCQYDWKFDDQWVKESEEPEGFLP